MGKPTDFLEYTRTEAAHRPERERIRDWDDFVIPHDPDSLRRQAGRCMDCGVPFCHAGMLVEGLSIGCPLSNLMPEINDLVWEGKLEAAYARLSSTHPFPEFTSRVCPALCEGSCTAGEHGEAVTVRDIERYLVDEMFRRGLITPQIPAHRTGRRVAVVGSGPSGLACADLLNQLGDTVAVYEKADRPGGLLMYGIPNMKLDKKIVENRVEILKKEGIQFILNTNVGENLSAVALLRDFDAIVLCGGARIQRMLTAPGADAEGVSGALEYLTDATKALLEPGFVPTLTAEGKDVFILGGGDTGTDCVATAIRQGAKSITQLEIMPCPPKERGFDNPWPLWPKVFRTGYGLEEAIAVYGRDPREYEKTVKEIHKDELGHVAAVTSMSVHWKTQNGRLVPVEQPGSEETRPAGLVLAAMGFTGPEEALVTQLGLERDDRGNVKARPDSHRSSLHSIFAAGDMRRGPSLVVWAMQEGRRAAQECHDYLMERK